MSSVATRQNLSVWDAQADECSSSGLDGDSAAAKGETDEDDNQCLRVLGV